MNDLNLSVTPSELASFQTTKPLSELVVLVRTRTSSFSRTKKDPDATQVVENHYGVHDAGHFSKSLLKNSDRVKRYEAAKRAAKKFIKDSTVPYKNAGESLLKLTDYQGTFKARLQPLLDEELALRKDLQANWDYEVQADMARLKNMANPKLYPADLSGLDFIVEYEKVPDSRDWLGLQEEDKAALEASILLVKENMAKELLTRLQAPMKALSDRLAEYTGDKGQRWKPAVVEALTGMVRQAEWLNVTNDPRVTEVTAQIREALGTFAVAPEALKHQPERRAEIKDDLDAVMDKMAVFF